MLKALLAACVATCHLALILNTAFNHYRRVEKKYQFVRLKGDVISPVKSERHFQQFIFQPHKVWRHDHWQPTHLGALLARQYGKIQWVQYGDQITLNTTLKPVNAPVNPYAFDGERRYFTEQVFGFATVHSIKQHVTVSSIRNYHFFNVWRTELLNKLRVTGHRLRLSSFSLGLLAAVTLGYRGWLTSQDWQLFQRTGLSHLMAISGLHIGLFALGLMFILSKLRYIFPLSLGVIGLIIVLAATGYALLSGFSLPTERAVLMLGIVFFYKLNCRRISFWHFYCLCLVMVLISAPLAILQLSFLLSFIAVAYLGYFSYGRLDKLNKARQLLQLQVKLSIVLMPFNWFFFHMTAYLSALINLFVIPFFSFFMLPAALLSLLTLLYCSKVNSLFLVGFAFLADNLRAILLPLTQHLFWWQKTIPTLALFLAILGSVLAFAPRAWPGRWLAVFFFLPLYFGDTVSVGEVEMTVFDVGQGLSVLIKTAHHQLLYDTGPSWPGGDRSAQILPSIGRRAQLDAIVVSHRDRDHVGGLKSIHSHYPEAIVYTNHLQPIGSIHPHQCLVGQKWQWDGISFQFLYPSTELWQNKQFKRLKRNNHSCVLKVSGQHFSIIMPGDLERSGEQYLLATQAQQLRADILIAPHHGSKTSSSQALIDAVQPKWVFIANGYLNRYNFPATDSLRRYRLAGAKVFDTAHCGAIQLRVNTFTPVLSPICWRQAHRGLWRRPYRDTRK